jgi:hypothetical protein
MEIWRSEPIRVILPDCGPTSHYITVSAHPLR